MNHISGWGACFAYVLGNCNYCFRKNLPVREHGAYHGCKDCIGKYDMPLPKEAAERKTYPITSGVLDYFPDAIAEVAHVSFVGNQQHNPGQPLHWDKSKSKDEADALVRHLLQRGTMDSNGVRHSAKVAWRALAMLQREIEGEQHGT